MPVRKALPELRANLPQLGAQIHGCLRGSFNGGFALLEMGGSVRI